MGNIDLVVGDEAERLDLRMREQAGVVAHQAEIQRARADEQIRAQREALAEREAFLSFVAHELRNPLTVLLGNVEYLLSARRPVDAEKQSRILGNLQIAGERLQGLVADLLAISRLQRGEGGGAMAPVALHEVVENAVDELVLQATDRRIDLDVDLRPDLPRVRGEATALLRLFTSLLDNAIKYTPVGGRVTVRGSQENGLVRVAVSNTGPGIPAEAVPHLFDLYFRARAGATPFAKGPGVGLALVKAIVDRHGGEIAVDSEAGVGTTFTVSLHRADA